ncbi:4Fe-4S ferredoxin N-terminal domain-containing protein [Natronococcus sp. A-GB7]|uniref:4Fe-4S ferredoxin N-terminal domain-containing protein n=1 Tax=Natronococcus sp. A-GB7 TaxID=3037649 RepID=UPI00241DBF16|nr:4Fe-4S ferredoxin N-terminal domain-containing protein [Natronococcus sp. A-GB7]MDG5818885.1 4Fe-4S ferredoxin N-terminal domain-containing protein [Natronococcus sp. A-GB7]
MSADDESFHPLGEEWENDLEGMLDDTEYDTDLGMAMAEDAMRVTRGELSEADFHEKYHEEVLEEFGEDNRPTQEAYEKAQEEAKGTVGRMLSRFDGDGEEPRRDVMKKMGAGAAAVGLGAWATVDDGGQEAVAAQDEEDDESGAPEGGEGDVQWGMAIDLERCDGCLSCVTACSSENNLDQGVNWMYVLEFEDPGASSSTSRNRLVRPCQHCTDAPCEKVCPTTARHTRDSDGLVLTDYDVCIGCRYCQVACPYGVNYFQWDEPDISTDEIAEFHEDMDGDHMTTDDGYGSERWVDSRAPRGVMSKCTMCPTRQDGQMGDEMVGTTACEEACPPDAIQFGNMHNESSDPQKYADNPARGRTLAQINPPSADELEEDLEGADEDLESVLEAADLDEEELALMIAVQITGGDEMGDGDGDVADLENDVTEALAAIESHGLGLANQEVLAELDLADEPDLDEPADGDEEGVDVDDEDADADDEAEDEEGEDEEENDDDEEENGDDEEEEDEDDEAFEPDEEAAQFLLEQFAGTPASNFKLLEEQGTNPNIIYLGNEPGPQAEQTEPTGTGVNYEDISYERADGESVEAVDNRKDVLDEGTVGDAGVSL